MVCSYGGLEHCQVEKLIMVAWAIWTNRNESRHGGVKKNNRALLQWLLDYLENIKHVLKSLLRQRQVVLRARFPQHLIVTKLMWMGLYSHHKKGLVWGY